MLTAAAEEEEKLKARKVNEGHIEARTAAAEILVDDGLPVRIAAIPEERGERTLPLPAAVGWHGVGAPRVARHMSGDKPFCDGGGLCSPGRWRRDKRRLPATLPGLKPRIVELFGQAVHRASGGTDNALKFMLKLCAGRLKEAPFAEEDLAEMRKALRETLGMEGREDTVAEGQAFHLALIAKTLKAFEDPDWRFIEGLSDGVALGVDQVLPRAPAVFEEKEKWRLAEEPGQGADAQGNLQVGWPLHLAGAGAVPGG